MHKLHRRRERSKWYAWGKQGGKLIVSKGFDTEGQGWTWGAEAGAWDDDLTVTKIHTVDRDSAKRAIKSLIAGRTGELGAALKPAYKADIDKEEVRDNANV